MATITTFLSNPTGYPTERVTLTGSVTANIGDFVEFLTVQPGWQVHDVQLNWIGTTSSTASVGDTGSATRYMNAVSTASSGFSGPNTNTAVTSGVISAGPGFTYTAADAIGITIGGANVSAKQYTLSISFTRTQNA